MKGKPLILGPTIKKDKKKERTDWLSNEKSHHSVKTNTIHPKYTQVTHSLKDQRKKSANNATENKHKSFKPSDLFTRNHLLFKCQPISPVNIISNAFNILA